MNFDIISQGCFLRELYLLLRSNNVQAAESNLYDVSPLVEMLEPHAGLVLDLPCDFPRPKQWSFRGDRVTTTLDSEIVIPHEGITPFVAFLTAFFIQLARVSGQEHIIMGVPY